MTASATAVRPRLLIPKVFHRIWLGGPLPERERAFGETWRRHHPDWQLRLWRDEDVPPLANQALFDAAGSAASKADILRYELLLEHGGIHLGAGLECHRSIEALLGGVELFCAREDGFGIGDGLLGCAPGHPFLAAVVAALPDSVAWRPGRPPAEQTGAGLLTRAVAEQDGLGNAVPVVFGPDLFAASGEASPGSYVVRHRAPAWAAGALSTGAGSPATGPAAGPPEPVSRILVTVDPDLVESAAVVLSGALEVASATPGTELALVVKGAPAVTEAVADAMAGLLSQLAGDRELPDVVVYGEPEGAALGAAARIAMSRDPAENARALLSLAGAFSRPVEPSPPAAVYVGGGRLLVRTTRGDRLYCAGDDLVRTPGLALDGTVDPALCGLADRRLRPGDTAVDVGADIGALTVVMARAVGGRGRVVAYEADPGRLALLRDNIAVNGVGDRVEIHERAVPGGDAPVPPAPRLIHVDAGGAEADALGGLRLWLTDAPGTALAVRVVRERTGKHFPALADQLSRLAAQGWQAAVLQPDGTTSPAELAAVLRTGRSGYLVMSR